MSVAIGLALICLVPGGHGEVSESIYLLVQRKTENAVGRGAWPSAREPQGAGLVLKERARAADRGLAGLGLRYQPPPPLSASEPVPKPPDLSCFGFKMGITQSGPGDVHKGASCPCTANGTWGAAPLSPGVPLTMSILPQGRPHHPPPLSGEGEVTEAVPSSPPARSIWDSSGARYGEHAPPGRPEIPQHVRPEIPQHVRPSDRASRRSGHCYVFSTLGNNTLRCKAGVLTCKGIARLPDNQDQYSSTFCERVNLTPELPVLQRFSFFLPKSRKIRYFGVTRLTGDLLTSS